MPERMRTIGVTVTVRRFLHREIEISEDDYEAFVNGDLDELDIDEIDLAEMFDSCRGETCFEETDYSICDENGETIVDWND